MTDESGAEYSRLFEVLNLNSENQYITKEQLANISGSLNISSDELDIIFGALDQDNDGHISAEDLKLQIQGDCSTSQNAKSPSKSRRSPARTTDANSNEGASFKNSDFSNLSSECQEQVCELYQKLHSTENPELLTQFETIILGVIKDVRQYQTENERLEKTYKREKEQHERHLRSLEDEMDVQMQKVEERVRKVMTEKADVEKAELRVQLDAEINMLQQNLKRLQCEGIDKYGKENEEHLMGLKTRLEELQYENRQMKSELTDTQTNLALVRSELASLKQQHKEKCHELDLEKETVMDYIKEQDNLTRQLHMLHDANKKLHDANDDLREALETRHKASHKRTLSTDSGGSVRSTSPRSNRKGSVMSDYIDTTPGNRSLNHAMSVNSSLAEELCFSESMVAGETVSSPFVRLRRKESCEDDSVPEEMDSGHSTMRDYNENDTESECPSFDGEVHKSRRHKRLKAGYLLEEDEYSHDEMDTDAETMVDRSETDLLKMIQAKKLSSSGSRGSRGSLRSLPKDESPKSSRQSIRRQLPTSNQEVTTIKVTKDPERMYKIVLAGDAAVGKSSFIMRLCKGKFVNNLSSTLGVDFQTKVLEVDGRTVALQLWDTAGQERFRSIAKSYFRRADGVLCLYDCTYERSFLNVRDWVEAVEDGAQKKIPIMLCANKTDLRQEMEQQGRRVVKEHDGVRLAREFDGLFIETSAKDGSNISEAVVELTRLLRTNEDLEVKTVGMQLHDMKYEKKGGCCKR